MDARGLPFPILVLDGRDDVASHRSPETFTQQYGRFIKQSTSYRGMRVVSRDGEEYVVDSVAKGPRIGPLLDRWTLTLGWRYQLTITLSAAGRRVPFEELRERLMREFGPRSNRRSRGDFDEFRAAVGGARDVPALIQAFARYDV